MKKTILLVLLVCCSCFNIAFSQKGDYEKGYFIDNNNKKVECLIHNEEWDYNPTQFEYKTDDNAAAQTMQLSNFSEFAVNGEYKYVKANVRIDKSNDYKRDRLTAAKAMNFVDDVLLLRVRVEGKATLYSYATADYTRFFYSINWGPITPLSYKIYYDSQEYDAAKNETYKQELLNALKCESMTQATINNLEYTISNLSDFFIKFNKCSGSSIEEFAVQKNYKNIELYAKGGFGITSFSYDHNGYKADFSKKTTFKIGLEAEINLSTKAKNWSVLFEAVYFKYSNSYDFDFANPVTSKLDLSAINVSAGVRKHFVLNRNSSIFINGYVTYQYPMDPVLKNNYDSDLKVSASLSPAFGIGYIYNTKYLLEMRYDFNRNLFTNAYSHFNTVGLMLGYKFL